MSSSTPGAAWAGLVAPLLFDRLPCRTTRLCFEIDGRFPNHEANPLIEENRRDIVERVVAEGGRHRHRLGRRRGSLLLHRRRGRVRPGRLHHRAPRRSVSAEASRARRSSTTCARAMPCATSSARYGGTSLMNRVGHAFFKRRMRETDAIFGGEVTGHYYFRDNFYADNGFIPALLILELMSKKGQSLRELLEPLRAAYFISGEINTKLASMDAVPATARGRSPPAMPTASQYTARRALGRVPGLALQRPAVEHRAAAAAESRGDDARPDGAEARRGAGAHPRVIIWVHCLDQNRRFRVGPTDRGRCPGRSRDYVNVRRARRLDFVRA